MAIISLLMLAIVVMAFVMRGAPKSKYEDAPPLEPAAPLHPWSSGNSNDIDDFAGPGAPYGPGVSNGSSDNEKSD